MKTQTANWKLLLGISFCAIGTILFASIMALSEQNAVANTTRTSEDQTLRHVVMFKFKESSSESDIQTVVDAFRELPSKIPEIQNFEYGVNNSPEDLADGFTHCFLVTFASEAERDVYLPHDAHKAFVEVLKPHLDKVMVIDYFANQ